MNQTRRGAKKLADNLRDNETPLIHKYPARNKVKEIMDMRSLGKKEDVSRGFEDSNWKKDGGMFYHPGLLEKKITDFEEDFRREGKFVIQKPDLVNKLSDSRNPDPNGDWGSIIEKILTERGWVADSDCYILPVGEVLESDNLLYYIFKSMEQVVDDS